MRECQALSYDTKRGGHLREVVDDLGGTDKHEKQISLKKKERPLRIEHVC